ncbi:SLC13 family permease [Campylobacter jejuni]|nr:SLC13 family permease [Campylobacter jejuni]EAI0259908.1 SLC13 family permease [Campylobacter jejuni]EHH2670760.1 SLC13 family permease [Campylobacter jejuni]EHR1852184.1 SLC13 family permease [Campylobacter jejuni]EIC9331924.1 SLC13 family permease [Campylobacter jejuni]
MKIIVGITLLILLILLIRNKIKPAVLFGSLAGFYYALGYLDFKTWISSYTNDSLISLMLLLLVSIAVEKTIIIEWASKFIIGKNYNLSLLRLGVITCAVSAFLNNTAVVASFMGIVKNNKFQAPSKLLIPLSYFAIVGGVITLVGTSTNLIINSFVVQNGLPSLKMFDFFYIGIALSIGMILVLMIFSKLLPNYENKDKNIKEHLIALKVLENSSLIGKSIEENKLRNLEFLFLVEIQRNNQSITPVSHNEIINAKDTLIFSGNISQLETLNKFDGLKLADGYELKESKFIDAIISLQRGDVYIKKIGKSVLQAGDRMILAVGKDFILRDNLAKNFYLLSNIKQNEKLDAKKSLMTIMAFLSVIVFSALNFISFTKALLICLGFLLLCKFIKLDEVKRRFPFDIFIIVGSSLAITKVLVDSGLAKDLAQLITGFFGHYGVYGSFIGVYLLTLLLTEFITNNAAAALAFPIGFATAQALGVNPLPFIFAVAYGASAGFMIPHGYQTHLMVSSLCDYKMTDFIKIGAIVSIVYSAIVLIGIPLIFNF